MKTDKEYIELLKQYRIRPLSREELQELLEWLDTDEGEDACSRYMDTLMEGEQPFFVTDTTRHRVRSRIQKTLKLKSLMRYKRFALGAAATVLLMLAGSGLTYFTQIGKKAASTEETILRTDRGDKAMLTLADGSKVCLNAESVLSYSTDGTRRVTLEGEAYFEVAKDKAHPFEVSTPYGTIRVYGTSFNVNAHKRDSLFAVALVEGSVGLKMNHLEKEMRMQPDEKICYNQKDNSIRKTSADMTDAGIWRKRELKLVDVDIATLWKKMGHWYGMKFRATNIPQKNHLYNITIQAESVEKMLGLISAITPIEYTIKGKEVDIRYK